MGTVVKDYQSFFICCVCQNILAFLRVPLDLPSGYIFVEELTENRSYSTWQVSAQQLLSDVGLKVKYFVSDRAKALVKLALNDLGCPSVADLFHALFDLSKGLGWELNCLASRLQKQLNQARHNSAAAELIEQLEMEILLQDWVKQQLLPALYWQQQVSRTKTPTLKRAYQVATELAFSSLMRHPITASLESEQRQQWFDWASWMVSKFQRSSSAVEGRNGYLSQVYHNRRGLSSRRLQVMTVIHNFHLKRPDGTTAAERLFGREFPDLFQWLVSDLGELPHPRKPRKPRKTKTFALPTVPS